MTRQATTPRANRAGSEGETQWLNIGRYERHPTLAEARARCAEIEKQHGPFVGIYRGHREYIVQIRDLSDF